tara:strand:- start:364 stop:678 length:315 start_codon:yes stop_codon:yes gene_type:complete
MFLRKADSEGKVFYVVCADWEVCLVAKDQEEAAALSIEESYRKYGKNMCISPTISVMDLSELHTTFDAVDHIHLLYTPEVLANAGLHELSKKFKKLIRGTMGNR